MPWFGVPILCIRWACVFRSYSVRRGVAGIGVVGVHSVPSVRPYCVGWSLTSVSRWRVPTGRYFVGGAVVGCGVRMLVGVPCGWCVYPLHSLGGRIAFVGALLVVGIVCVHSVPSVWLYFGGWCYQCKPWAVRPLVGTSWRCGRSGVVSVRW